MNARAMFVTAVVLGPAVAPCQAPPIQRHFDLRFLCAADATPYGAERETPNESPSDLPRSGGQGEPRRGLDPEWFAAMLRAEVGSAQGDDLSGPRFSWEKPGVLLVSADPGTQERIAASIDRFCAWWTEQVTVELHVLPAAGGGRGLLRKDEAERFLGASGPHRVYVSRGRIGQRLVLQSNRDESFVRDMDTEVAQGSNILDPKVDVLRLGEGAEVTVSHAMDGKVLVAFTAAAAERDGDPVVRAVRNRDARNAAEECLVQLPRLSAQFHMATVALADGEAVSFGLGAASGRQWCLRVRRPSPSGPPSGDRWRVHSVGALRDDIAPARRYRHPLLREPGDDAPLFTSTAHETADGPAGEAKQGVGALPAADLALADRLREALRGEAGRAIDVSGDLVLVRAPDEDLRAVGQRLQRMHAEAIRQAVVEVRHGVLDAATLSASLDPSGDAGELAARLPNQATIVSLMSGWFTMRGGREVSFLRDYEVEIAQESATSNPVVDVAFSGVTLTGQVLPAGPARYRLDLDFGFAQLAGEIETFDAKNPRYGGIDLPRSASTWFRIAPVLQNDRWTLVHAAPMDGDDRSFVVVARVRE